MTIIDEIKENIRIMKETMADLESNKKHQNRELGLITLDFLYGASLALERENNHSEFFTRTPFYKKVLEFSKNQYLQGEPIPEDTRLYGAIQTSIKMGDLN